MPRLNRIEAFVYENTEANKLFYQYLKLQHSTEGLDFLNMVKEIRVAYKQLNNEERLEVIKCLLTTFLKKESPLINISYDLNLSILQQWSELQRRDEISLEAFNQFILPVERCILVQLKLDIFPSFCHSPIFKEHLAKKPKESREAFINKVTYIPQRKQYFDYNYTSLFESEITDQDFDLGKLLCEEQGYSNWKNISTNSFIANNVQLSSEITDFKNLSVIKWEGNLECDLHKLGSILSSVSNVEDVIEENNFQNFISLKSSKGKSDENTKLHLLVQFSSKWFRQRQCCSTIQWKRFQDPECIVGICKSLHPDSKYFSTFTYPLRHFTVIYLNPSSKLGETKYTVITLYDAKGFMRGNIKFPWIKRLIIQFGNKFHKMMKRIVSDGTKIPSTRRKTSTSKSRRYSEGESVLQSLKS